MRFPRLHSASDELLHLDFLRLIASCGIVLLHFARFLSPETRDLVGPLGGFTLFVDLFFAISGFVIAYVYTGRIAGLADYRRFLQRRVARLGPLHWATFLVFLALGALIWSGTMGTDHPEVYDPRCAVPNALALHAWGVCRELSFNDVSWSISAEMGMYIIAPLLIAAGARRPWLLFALVGISIVLLSQAPRQPWLDWTWYFGVLRALPSFAVGILFYRYRDTIARLPWARTIAVAGALLFLIGVRLEWERIVLLPIVYLIVAAVIACDLGKRYRPLVIGAWGQLTYSLYMLHPLVRTFGLSFVGQRVLKLEGWMADVGVLVGFVATFVLGYLSFVYFETPARRALGERRRPAGAAAAAG